MMAIPRNRCPICKATRPAYLIASHIEQCKAEQPASKPPVVVATTFRHLDREPVCEHGRIRGFCPCWNDTTL